MPPLVAPPCFKPDRHRRPQRPIPPLLLLLMPPLLALLLRTMTTAAAARADVAAALMPPSRRQRGAAAAFFHCPVNKQNSRYCRRVSSLATMVNPADVPALTLRGTGDKFPVIGLGTWKAEPGKVKEAVVAAIKAGYRHIDCACDYGNEEEVGEALKQVMDEGVVTRPELFITSKLWNTYHAQEHVEPAIRKTLTDLGLDYLDLYLIHFPISLKFVPFETRYPPEWIHDPSGANPRMEFADVPIHETWAGMESVCAKGLARNIGVSNFNAQSVMDLMKYAKVKPAVNQIELHPYLAQESLVWYCQQQGIAITGFSPLGASSYIQLGMDQGEGVGVLNNPVIQALAAKHNRSPAQICLRWAVQRGYAAIPKSTKAERLAENISVFDFELSEEEMAQIMGLNRGLRYNDPGVFCKGMGGSYPIYA